jgi:hypothetical protein
VFTETSRSGIQHNMMLGYSKSVFSIPSFVFQLLEGCMKSFVQRYIINLPRLFLLFIVRNENKNFEFEIPVSVSMKSYLPRCNAP